MFDRRRIGAVLRNHGGQLPVQIQQTLRQIIPGGMANAIGHMGHPAAIDINDAPAKVPQAGINP
jgi:hypothetical protein